MNNRIHDAFDKIEASPELRASAAERLNAEREKRSRRRPKPAWGRKIAAACASFAVLLGVAGFVTVRTPAAYVSIDVNPSVELSLNVFDRVIDATAYNDDGAAVLGSADVGGMYYMDAIDAIVEGDAMRPYLTGDASLTFTVASGDNARETSLIAGIESCSGCMEHGGRSYGAELADVDEAHANGLSLGKYSAYLTLSQYDAAITADDCRDMTMSELRSLISEHEGGGSGHGGGACGESTSDSESETQSGLQYGSQQGTQQGSQQGYGHHSETESGHNRGGGHGGQGYDD